MTMVHEVEIGLATHDDLRHGVTAGEIRKVLVAADTADEAVRTAIDMAWRGDQQITYAHYAL